MKLTIFGRIILVQGALFAFVVLMSAYAISHLDRITQLNNHILTVDTVCVQEGKRLVKVFLSQMRNAEKYLILQDPDLYANFIRDKTDVLAALEKMESLVDSPLEEELIERIRYQQDRYERGIHSARDDMEGWKETRAEISDEIINDANELIHIREKIIEEKTTSARDQALGASRMVAWLASGGMLLALLLAYIHARSISTPLNKLAREMRRLGRGDPVRRLQNISPPEIRELADTFHTMAEALAELERMKADFTAHVSHELRTPLTGIREGTSLLLEEIPGPITPAQAEILGVVQSHSGRLYATISSILDLSKMEKEMMEYDMTACDLSTLIQTGISNVSLIAQKKRTRLTSIVPEPLPLVFIDERRIQQVLDNLLSNALKFNGDGGEIIIAARTLPFGMGRVKEVEVRIRDNGTGIPESDLEKVFTKFYQSHQDRHQKHRGTGLGLAIARHIIQAHKGRIWVESQPGRGSIFIFTLPVDPMAEAGIGVADGR